MAASSLKFFIDNNLGKNFADGMKAFGEEVVHISEHMSSDSPDEVVLRYVGDNNLIFLTRDKNIRWKPAEIAAIKRYEVLAFILVGKNLDRCKIIKQMIRIWPKIKNISGKARRPGAYRIPPSGTEIRKIPL